MAKAHDSVKTTVKLPRALWKRVHMRAMDDEQDMNDLVIAALERYLKGSRA